MLRTIEKHPEGITNTEISKELNKPINCITPRTNELKKQGYVTQKETRKCKMTGRSAIAWTTKKN